MSPRGAMLSLLALASLSSAAASAQPARNPRSDVDAAVNGMASLCPALVGGGAMPDAAAAERLGYRPLASDDGTRRLRGRFGDGLLQLVFDPGAQRCSIHFGGPAYREVAAAGRTVATSNGFRFVESRVEGAVQHNSYVRMGRDAGDNAYYVVIENPTVRRAVVSYKED